MSAAVMSAGCDARADDAGVVDEHVEAAVGADGRGRRRDGRVVGDVDLHELGAELARRRRVRGIRRGRRSRRSDLGPISRRAVSYPRLLLAPVMSVVVMFRVCAGRAASAWPALSVWTGSTRHASGAGATMGRWMTRTATSARC